MLKVKLEKLKQDSVMTNKNDFTTFLKRKHQAVKSEVDLLFRLLTDSDKTEIIDLMKTYLDEDLLNVSQITRGVAWLDTGTPKSLLEASSYVGAIEERQGLKIACLEEVAMRMGYINLNQYRKLLLELPNSPSI